MAPTLVSRYLSLISLFCILSSILSFASVVHHHGHVELSSPSSKLDAQRLIRGLNLFPRHPYNKGPLIKEDNSNEPRLVETTFNLSRLLGDGASVEDLGHHAGYFRLPRPKDASLFYYFFESRNKKSDPVVIWLQGGPGCSSNTAFFFENGPFHISNNLTLQWNDFGWDTASNIIYVDQPIGTGFSYTSDESDIPTDEDGVSNDLYDFLQAFFGKHRDYATNDFYITGESYAGHYIPAFASRIHKGNKAKEGIPIKLKGFAIGNGLTNPSIQYAAYPDYARDTSLIGESNYNDIKSDVPACQQAIKECQTDGVESCLNAYGVCTDIFSRILAITGDINYYDIRKQCVTSLCYDFSKMEDFLNQDSVKKALGVDTSIEFVSCSTTVYDALRGDWMKNLDVGIPELLEDGINLLIYAGEYDLICNWLGNYEWVQALKWSGQDDFSKATNKTFQVDGKEAGRLKSHGPLAFLKVHDAGHLVPMDQPKASLEMLKRWTHGQLV